MNPDEHEAILDEIDRLAGRPELQPGDITIMELREKWGITSAAVQGRMDKVVEAGRYTTHLVYHPEKRRVCRVYRKVVSHTEKGE